MGVASIKQLPTLKGKTHSEDPLPSKYHGITYLKRRGTWSSNHFRLGKTFSTQEAAAASVRAAATVVKRKRGPSEHKKKAAAAAEATAVKRKSGSSDHKKQVAWGQLKGKMEPRTILMRMKFLARVYHVKQKLLLPADIRQMVSECVKSTNTDVDAASLDGEYEEFSIKLPAVKVKQPRRWSPTFRLCACLMSSNMLTRAERGRRRQRR